MILAMIIALAFLCALLMLVSYVERVYAEMGKILSREFEENIESYEQRVESKLGVGTVRTALSMQLLSQLTTAAISLVIGYAIFSDGRWSVGEIFQAAVIIVLLIIVFNRLLPYVLFIRTKGDWLARLIPVLKLLIWLALPLTIVLGFSMSVASLAEPAEPEQPEHSSEAVDALLEAGTEEGILEESDRELIHSVVEFGDKIVREVMTARPDMVAVPASATIEQLTELLKQHPHSRIPVYEPDLDHIQGIVFAQDVLQVRDEDASTETARRFMRPTYLVPEMKKVSELLREMQREKIQMAIAIDEYGGVAGLVTLEDMLEEIVGEIEDEHKKQGDIVRESESSYVLPGATDLDVLEEFFDTRPADVEATTVAGLVSEVAGRIPHAGEIVEHDGMRFEVLESTDRRIERVRVSKLIAQPEPKIAIGERQ
ncbi:MAG: HlyC/CorC family transporter [Acidobacteria bacterium]|nr:HlyC/CorC family transporter [Acidobacteriota bacterium]MBV9147963.1 HlyC/CorC family transporter [Acidobacteriota bacterium]MBV9434647.1 HlyC/CorC family transporter [Acidobacteriota bacterium]